MASCENNMNDVKALNSKQGGIDIGKDVAIYVSDNGKMSAKLMAPIMKKYLVDSGKMVEFPNTIKVDLLLLFISDSHNTKVSNPYSLY